MSSVAENRIAWRIRRLDANPGSSMAAVILLATDREFAKSYSSPLLGGDPDYYQVEPLTDKGEAVTFLLFT